MDDILSFAGVGNFDMMGGIDADDVDAFLASTGGSVTDNGVDVTINFGAGIGELTINGLGTGSINSIDDLESAGNTVVVS